MAEKDKLDIREFIIEDDIGNIIGDLSLISFVADPAIGQNFQLFSKTSKYVFAQADEEKMQVTGPIMRPNVAMLRQDPVTGKYYNAFFTPKQVLKCAQIFLKNSNHTQSNLEHGELLTRNELDGLFLFESWIVEDPENDKANAKGFKELKKDDWYGTFQIENKEFWKYLKENGGGFSIEGMFAEKIYQHFRNKQIESKVKEITFSKAFSDNEKEKQIKNLLGLK